MRFLLSSLLLIIVSTIYFLDHPEICANDLLILFVEIKSLKSINKQNKVKIIMTIKRLPAVFPMAIKAKKRKPLIPKASSITGSDLYNNTRFLSSFSFRMLLKTSRERSSDGYRSRFSRRYFFI